MFNFLGGILSWQLLVAVAIVIALIFILSRVLVHKPKAVKVMLKVLDYVGTAIEFFLPAAKFKPVYDAVLEAIQAVADGNFTQEEALSVARDSLKVALDKFKVTLTEEEAEFIDRILAFVVDILTKDKAAAKVAVQSYIEAKKSS